MSPDPKPTETGNTADRLRGLARRYHLIPIALAVISFYAYALAFGWLVSAMLMLCLGVHEYGHVWAMKRCGVGVKGVYFIPFLGAVAMPDRPFPSRGAEALIAIMGPVWGLVMTLFCLGVALITLSPIFIGLTFLTAMINLLNLLPANPMDGGRVIKSAAYSVSPWTGLVVTGLTLVASIGLIWWAFPQIGPMISILVGYIGYRALSFDHRAVRAAERRQPIIAAVAAELNCPATAGAVTNAITETVMTNIGDLEADRAFRRRVLNAAAGATWADLTDIDNDDHNDLAVFLRDAIGSDAMPKMTGWQAVAIFSVYLFLTTVLAGLVAALMAVMKP